MLPMMAKLFLRQRALKLVASSAAAEDSELRVCGVDTVDDGDVGGVVCLFIGWGSFNSCNISTNVLLFLLNSELFTLTRTS